MDSGLAGCRFPASPLKLTRAFLYRSGLTEGLITNLSSPTYPHLRGREKNNVMGDDEKEVIEGDDGAKTGQDGQGDDGAGQAGTDDGQGDDSQGKNKDDSGQSQNKQDGEDDAPPVRKTASDYYKERQERKKAVSQAKNAKDDAGDDEKGSDDDEDISPEDEALIEKVIKKRYGHVFENITAEKEAAADREEATKFFEEKPEFKPFEAKILKWWGDPSRRHLPIETVALEAVGFNNLVKIGAQLERQAAEKAKQTSTTGGGAKANGGQKSIADMSDDEIRALNQQVLANRQ